VLRVNHNVASLIREGKTALIQSAIQAGQADGMLPLERCLTEMIRRREIRVEDARAVVNDESSFQSYLR
jgi:twitching motility protein PilT